MLLRQRREQLLERLDGDDGTSRVAVACQRQKTRRMRQHAIATASWRTGQYQGVERPISATAV